MKTYFSPVHLFLLVLVILLTVCSVSGQTDPARQWPAYRGYLSSGVLDNANLPETFDPETMSGIKWKTEIPGLGLASPVIWDDKLFITTAVSQSDKEGLKIGLYGDVVPVSDSSVHEWKVLCFNKNNGKLIWKRPHTQGFRR